MFVVCGITAAVAAPTEKIGGHFAWGAEAGGSIDMTSNDMSTLNLDAFFGYRNSWIDVAGVGAGIHVMVSNSCRSFPIYGLFRTSFRSQPSLFFMDLRAGCVYNNNNGTPSSARLYVAPGVGFNLARSKSFTSFITLSYEFNGMREYKKDGDLFKIANLDLAMIKIGICF